MATINAGGVVYDQGETSRANRNQLLQAQQALQQAGQFRQQQALQVGQQQLVALDSMLQRSGDMANIWLASDEGKQLLAGIQQNFSIATGKKLTPEQALQTGLASISDVARQYPGAQAIQAAMASEYMKRGPQSAQFAPPAAPAVASGAEAAKQAQAIAPAISRPYEERVPADTGVGQSAGGAAYTPMGATAPSVTTAPYEFEFTGDRSVVRRTAGPSNPSDVPRQAVIKTPQGQSFTIDLPEGLTSDKVDAYIYNYMASGEFAKKFLSGAQSAPSTPATPGAPGTPPLSSYQAPSWAAPQFSGREQQPVPSAGFLPPSAESLRSPGSGQLKVISPSPGSSPPPQAAMVTGGAGMLPLTQIAQPGAVATARAPASERLGAGATTLTSPQEAKALSTEQFAQSIETELPWLSTKAKRDLVATADSNLKVPELVKQTRLTTSFEQANATLDSLAAGKKPTQRDKAALAEPVKRAKAVWEEWSAMGDDAFYSTYKDYVKMYETASPEELQALGFSGVADRAETRMLAKLQAQATVDAARARANGDAYAEQIKAQVEFFKLADKSMALLNDYAKTDKTTILKVAEKYPLITKQIETYYTAALGQPVTLDLIMKPTLLSFITQRQKAVGLDMSVLSGGVSPASAAPSGASADDLVSRYSTGD